MDPIDRAAITRVVVDLLKADDVIVGREMKSYQRLRLQYELGRHSDIESNVITLAQAVEILERMPVEERAELAANISSLFQSEREETAEKSLIMLALYLCLDDRIVKSDILSVPGTADWIAEGQILYVESLYNPAINKSIRENLSLITELFRSCGLEFIYIPEIIRHYTGLSRQFLIDVLTMLSPAQSPESINDLVTRIEHIGTDRFCVEQLHHKLGFESMLDTPPALVMRLNRSKVANEIATNFLRVELDDNVVERVRYITDIFKTEGTHSAIEPRALELDCNSFIYSGFYRQFFEILLMHRSVVCHVLIDLVHSRISFPEIEATLNGLHRKEKALYTLFVFEIANGGVNFSPPVLARQIPKFNKRMELIQRRYALIYQAFGGEAESAPDITKSEIRLPMISGIKRAINKYSDKIYKSDDFLVGREKSVYGICADPDLFSIISYSSPLPVKAFDSDLFKELANIK